LLKKLTKNCLFNTTVDNKVHNNITMSKGAVLNCHICNESTHTFIHEKTNISYYYCEKCAYIFKSPKYYQNFDTQKKRYNLHTNDENDEGYKAYFKRFLDFVLPVVGSPKDALDFGCGRSTILSNMIKNKDIKCDFYDPIYHPDTLNDDKKYDLIVSVEVFEHLHQPRTTFKYLSEKLNEEGYLAIQTAFHSNDIKTFKTWYYHQDPTHIVFFTPKTFTVLCKQYGCKLLATNDKNMVVIQKEKADIL